MTDATRTPHPPATSTPAAALRHLLAEPGLTVAPGVFDGLGAHLARRAGFDMAYITGAGVAASGYGLPDIGLVDGSEMAERIAVIIQAGGLPVLADADTGYGNPTHVVRTVHAYERSGVAGLHLEDQAFPKRCGHLLDKEIVGTDTFVRKLAAALEARRQDTVIVARTDARGPLGLDDAIARARRYAREGADAVFVEAPQSLAEIERIADEVGRDTGVPLVFNVVPGGRTPEVDADELDRLGFALAIHPGALLSPVAAAMSSGLRRLGGTDTAAGAGPAGIFDLVGLQEWTDLGKRYDQETPWV